MGQMSCYSSSREMIWTLIPGNFMKKSNDGSEPQTNSEMNRSDGGRELNRKKSSHNIGRGLSEYHFNRAGFKRVVLPPCSEWINSTLVQPEHERKNDIHVFMNIDNQLSYSISFCGLN